MSSIKNTEILVVSIRSIGTIVVMVLAGVYMKRRGIMTPQDRSHDACPKLFDQLKNGWPMVLLPIVYVGVGLLVGLAAAKAGNAPDNFRCSAIAAVAFPNNTGMPMTLLAVVYSQFSKESNIGKNNPLLFLSVYLMVYPVLQWSVGSWLLQPSNNTDKVLDEVLQEEKRQMIHRESHSVLKAAVKRIFPPPVVASLLGITMALVPPVKAMFVDRHRVDGAPLEFVFDGLQKIAGAAVPINMLILGASLTNGFNRNTVGLRSMLSVAFAKMFIMPLVGILCTIGLKASHVVKGHSFADSFYLVAMLVSATPTANNIIVMAELAGENKEGLAASICLQYLLAPVMLTFWLSIFVGFATSDEAFPWPVNFM